MNPIQIANSWCPVSVKKALKGLLYSMLGAAGLAALNFVGTIHIDNPLLATLVVTLLPSAVNAFNKWRQGVDPLVASQLNDTGPAPDA